MSVVQTSPSIAEALRTEITQPWEPLLLCKEKDWDFLGRKGDLGQNCVLVVMYPDRYNAWSPPFSWI